MGKTVSRALFASAIFGLAAIVMVAMPTSSVAQNASAPAAGVATGTVTGLPVPRFVSLKASRVNVRRGPSRTHQIDWIYQHTGLPVEVTAEFENWRRVRDFEGGEGWVFHTLLSGRRTVMVAPWSQGESPEELLRRPQQGAPIAARVMPKVVADVESCEDGWCRLMLDAAEGWITQDKLFGVYPGEDPS
ncbi:MAG: SH3 domain-containing protein [Pseudomonadota bacterium]